MRIKAENVSGVEVHELSDGGVMTVVPDGEVKLGSSVFEVRRFVFEHPDSERRFETHLIGKRGATYLLRPYFEAKGDSGLRQVISLNTGAPLRQKGNEVRVIEIAGVIERHWQDR